MPSSLRLMVADTLCSVSAASCSDISDTAMSIPQTHSQSCYSLIENHACAGTPSSWHVPPAARIVCLWNCSCPVKLMIHGMIERHFSKACRHTNQA
jgi:hypothetical protein